jgi:hypothetical protein
MLNKYKIHKIFINIHTAKEKLCKWTNAEGAMSLSKGNGKPS